MNKVAFFVIIVTLADVILAQESSRGIKIQKGASSNSCWPFQPSLSYKASVYLPKTLSYKRIRVTALANAVASSSKARQNETSFIDIF